MICRLDPATLPDGPGYQEYMEKKRKREEEKARRKAETQAEGPPGEGDDGEGFAALGQSKS